MTFLYRTIRKNQTDAETLILQAGGYYFLASLTAVNVLNPFAESEKEPLSYAYMILGGIVLYFYLMSKLKKSKRMISSFGGNNQAPDKPKNMKIEWPLIIATLLLYISSLVYPQIVTHKVNEWFYVNIADIYDTILLKFIFGIIGFFFLIQILFQGFNTTMKMLNIITGNTGSEPNQNQHTQSESGFIDYEIVDEESEDDPTEQQNLLN